MFAQVIIEYPLKSLDKTFIYHIPSFLEERLKEGMKVDVPFNNSKIGGFVLKIIKECPIHDYEIKDIIAICDQELILGKELLALASFLQEETLCSKITAIQTMLPSSLKVGLKKSNYNYYEKIIKLNNNIDLNKYIENNKRYSKQIEIINRLRIEKEILKKEINSSSLNTLIKNKIVIEEERQIYRINKDNIKIDDKVLTIDQDRVYKRIKECFNMAKTFLLYGVTASGKTEVYIKLIKDVISLNKKALVLVPEISLTTQIALRFYNTFGKDVAILHSSLSSGEKYDEYLKIIRDEVHVVVGTRSAVFAPLKDLGIIIIDEEDSSSYKQDNYPKYNAKDMAIFRSKYNLCPLVLASATPSLESKARADKGVYELLTLKNRVGKAKLPLIHIVSLKEEMEKKNMIFSDLLKNKIKEKLEKKEQIILLLNRRGFSTYINCSNCGYTYKCPNCEITLTYHISSNNLICHYCGYKISKASICPNCQENSLNYYGLGTEKLEIEIKKLFPLARVIRMDQDVTSKKGSHEKIINDFKNYKYDILLGTQMVSKGLDFPLVSLVGVINADTTLNLPDFRSNELTFALLHQVSGRAGRSNLEGEVVIQTFNPHNFVMECVKDNNYDLFYLKEMQIRRKLAYPPYYYLIGIKIISKEYNIALEEAQKVKLYLDQHLEKTTLVLGPTMASILKFKNEYRFQIIIKYKYDKYLKQVLKELDNIYIYNKNCYLDIDINPLHI